MKSLTNLVLSIPLILLFACSDETFELNEIDNRQNEVYTTSGSCNLDLEETNIDNPYDWYGSDHNDALDYVATKMSTITSAGDDMFFHIRDYLKTIYTSTEVQAHLDTIDMSYIEELTRMDTTDLANGMTWASFRDTYGPSSPSAGYTFLSDLHDLYESSNDPQVVIDTLINYEQSILSNSSLSDEEEQIQLGTISVLRHSIKYWNEAEVNTCHPYYDYVNAQQQYAPENTVATPRLDTYQLAVDVAQFYLQVYISEGPTVPSDASRDEVNAIIDDYIRRSLIGAIYASGRAYDPGFPGP